MAAIPLAAAERRSSMADFIVAQKLGAGSYGNVYKVQRKADKQRCLSPFLPPRRRRAQAPHRRVRCVSTPRGKVAYLFHFPERGPFLPRSYAIKEVNIRKLQPRER